MRKIILVSLAVASMVAMASPAAAQNATGTVNITGSVGDKCQVTPVSGGNYVTSRDLLELSQANGTLEATATLEGRFGVAGTTAPIFRVVCTTAAPKVSLNASPLLHTTPALQASSSGYTGTVNYTATSKVTTVAGSESVSDATTAATPTDITLASRLAASGNNVEITTSGYNAGTDLLNAGSYSGQIVVTISPI